jgi:signal transduction histidine kinase
VTGWALRQRITALCAVVGLVLVALGLVAVGTADASRNHLDTLLNKSGPMRTASEALTAALVDQETGIRGFAVTGDPAELAPYERGLANEKRLLDQITGVLGSGDGKIRGDVELVRAGAQQWREVVAEPVIAAVRTSGTAAGQALINDSARARFDGVRVEVTILQRDVVAFRDAAAANARQTGNTLVFLLIAAAAVILIAGIVLLVVLDRLVSRPVLRLADQVRRVANGEYERHIESAGAPELVRLAEDIEGMRRQIAAELAQVSEAREQIEWVNKQLHAQADELTRSNRDLEQFAYVASHDLQEPLRKVASFCQLLQRRYQGQLDERADQYIGFAVDGAQRMQRLINDLLAFSRIGRITAGFTDIELDDLLTGVAAQFEGRVGDGEIVWSGLPRIEGEEPLLTTLFSNLIGNSLKFRRRDVPVRVEISARELPGEWEVTVADNGIGIEPEFADKVFVIFQRLHGRDAYEGTGIGLAIVKKIVEYHGGRIWLDPDVREGTAIRFTFPMAPILDLRADAEAAA